MYSIAYLLIPNLFSTIAYAAPQIAVDERGPRNGPSRPPPLDEYRAPDSSDQGSNSEPLTSNPNSSASEDLHPGDGQSQPGGEAAPAGGQEPVALGSTSLPLPEPSYLPAPAENAKGPDGEDCHVWNGRLASNPLFAEGKKMALPCN
ncbi:MAG: hypothetical protein Q9198_000567 [Flavoplaca austrocitrina]